MPRPPAAGKKWVSVELDQDDYDVIVAAAKKDRRSLNMFLQVQLSDLASKLYLENMFLQGAGTQEQRKGPDVPAKVAAQSTEPGTGDKS